MEYCLVIADQKGERQSYDRDDDKYMETEIRRRLLSMAEEDYQKFSSKLIPGATNMLGIRLPQLRKLAKELVKKDWKTLFKEEDIYFEEYMLRGMILSYVTMDLDKILPYITEFIPLVNNWSVCDSVFMGMTVFQKDRECTWNYIQPYLHSNKEFEIRIALVIMMQHLLKCDETGKRIARLRTIAVENLYDDTEKKGLYLDRVLAGADSVDTTAYYASMAASWLIAEAFCMFPYHTLMFLKDNHLDARTYNKALQKIIESRIPTQEVKNMLRGMKINSGL